MENGRTSGKRGGDITATTKLSLSSGNERRRKEREKKGREGNLLFESSPSSKRLVNLCKVSGAGTGGGGRKVGGERRGATLSFEIAVRAGQLGR